MMDKLGKICLLYCRFRENDKIHITAAIRHIDLFSLLTALHFTKRPFSKHIEVKS